MDVIIKLTPRSRTVVINPGATTINLISGGNMGYLQATYNAGIAIASFQVVALVDGLLYPASTDNLIHANSVLGIALTEGITQQQITVITSGIITNAAWNWADDQPLFLGLNGEIVASPSFEREFMIQIGNAPSDNQVNIDLDVATLLSNS
jgi:hypothetical protein